MGTSFGLLTGQEAAEKGYLPAKVILDGVEMSNVVTVNDVEGWIEIFATDSNGKVAAFRDSKTGEYSTRTYRLKGDITYIPFVREEQRK